MEHFQQPHNMGEIKDADGNVVAGYERYVVFDERIDLFEIPPYFVPTGLYEIFSWLE